jgi:hypothetical protein
MVESCTGRNAFLLTGVSPMLCIGSMERFQPFPLGETPHCRHGAMHRLVVLRCHPCGTQHKLPLPLLLAVAAEQNDASNSLDLAAYNRVHRLERR